MNASIGIYKSIQYDKNFFAENNLIVENFAIIAEIKNAMVFMKDIHTRLVMANTMMLKAWGHFDKHPIIGLSNDEFEFQNLFKKYTKDDNWVLQGNTITDNLELVSSIDGNTLVLVYTTKYPLYNKDKKIIGLVSIMKPSDFNDETMQSPEIVYMKQNIYRSMKIDELAKFANKSVSALERSFKLKHNVSPMAYFNFIKINNACLQLKNSNKTIAEISYSLGFCDQSYMSRIFKNIIGVSPKEYRNQ